ncbi:MAG: AI-2E family transporter [Bdellovibrionales bacterium]|nr:AI-2E family transporter [Bdellovibrionales bacterium]
MEQDSSELRMNIIATCLLAITLMALAVALSLTRGIMIPFVVALFLSYFVTPIVDGLQQRWKVPHVLAVMGGLGVFSLFLLGLVAVFSDSVDRMIAFGQVYETKLSLASDNLQELARRFRIRTDAASLIQRFFDLPVIGFLQSAAGRAATLALDFSLVAVFLIFLVSGHNTGRARSRLRTEIDAKIRTYIMTKVGTSLVTGIVVWVALTAIGVDLALMFGVLAVFLNFIPTLGSIVATLLPLPVVLLEYGNSWRLAAVLLVPGMIQLVIGNVLEPKLMGKGLDLHPITVLISLMFWGLIWGIAGMFLAVPITAALKIIFHRIELTRGLSDLMAGRVR